jgi:hypothetical protein
MADRQSYEDAYKADSPTVLSRKNQIAAYARWNKDATALRIEYFTEVKPPIDRRRLRRALRKK